MTTLAQAQALGAAGFYVFELRANDKRPLREGWQAEATRTPTTWTPGSNVGIFAEKYGDDKALVIVDVDVKGKHNGEEAIFALDIEGFELAPTFEQKTPSGGRHLIYVADRAVAPSVSKIGAGIDIRSAGSYIVGPGSVLANGSYAPSNRIRPAPAPSWLVERAGAPSTRSAAAPTRLTDLRRAKQRGIDYLKTAPISVKGAGGDQTAYQVAAKLKDLGLDRTASLDLMMSEHWHDGCGWSAERIAEKIDHAWQYGKDTAGSKAPEAVFTATAPPPEGGTPEVGHPRDEAVKKLNADFAFVIAGGGSHILWETTDADGVATLEHLAEDAFHKRHAAWRVPAGESTIPATKFWMGAGDRRSYDGLSFVPGGRCDPRFYNLWRGFACPPAATSKHPAVDQWIEHARSNVCGGDDVLFRWLVGFYAHLVQRPEDKPLVSLVFRGAKGTGKNALVERVGALLGRHFLVTANRRYLTGNFNGHLERNLMLVLDEAFWSGDKQTEGIVKDLITGSHHVIEHKGKEPYRIRNLTRVVIIGNEKWIVPASHDERRFAVFNVGNGRQQDRTFFETMRLGMESGGYAHLLRYLLDAEISDVNAAPQTKALLEQKHASLEILEQWWFDSLMAGAICCLSGFGDAWPVDVTKDQMLASFQRYAKDRNVTARDSKEAFGRGLLKIAPSISTGKIKAPTGGAWQQAYRGLDIGKCRADWDKHMGANTEWPV